MLNPESPTMLTRRTLLTLPAIAVPLTAQTSRRILITGADSQSLARRELLRGLQGLLPDWQIGFAGAGELTFELRLTPNAAKPEDYTIRRDAKRVILEGPERGLLYAVFDFLEGQGVFFGIDGESYPLQPQAMLHLPPEVNPGRLRLASPPAACFPGPTSSTASLSTTTKTSELTSSPCCACASIPSACTSTLGRAVGRVLSQLRIRRCRTPRLPGQLRQQPLGLPSPTNLPLWHGRRTVLRLRSFRFRRHPPGARQLGDRRPDPVPASQVAPPTPIASACRTGVGFEPYQIPDEIWRALPPEAKPPALPERRTKGPRFEIESRTAKKMLEARLGQPARSPTRKSITSGSGKTRGQLGQPPDRASRCQSRHSSRHTISCGGTRPTSGLLSAGGAVSPAISPVFHKRLPGEIVFSCLSDSLGWDPIHEVFGQLEGRERWPIPWLEDDPAMWLPQFHVHRFERDLESRQPVRLPGHDRNPLASPHRRPDRLLHGAV